MSRTYGSSKTTIQQINWTRRMIKSRTENHEKAGKTHTACHFLGGREVQRWISLTCGSKVDVQILRPPCEIPASGKRNWSTVWAKCVCVSLWVMEIRTSIFLKRFPMLLNSDCSRIKLAASKTPGRLSERREVRSQTALSQSAPSSPLLRTSVSMFRALAFK